MWKKILLFLLILFLLPCLLIIGSGYFFLGTERGFSWTTERLQNFDDRLTLASTTGNLNDGIGTDAVTWDDDNLSVQANGIHSKWSSGCLLRSAFCLEKLNIEELAIETRPSEEDKPASTGPIELPSVLLPLKFNADEITIDKLTVVSAGSDAEPLVLENITLSAQASGSEFNIQNLGVKYKNFSVWVNGEIDLSGDYPIDANLRLDATDVLDEHDFRLEAKLSNTVANLKLDADVTGAATLTANADIQTLQPKTPLRANLTWQEIGWPLDTHETVTALDADIILAGNLDDYIIRVNMGVFGQQIPATDILVDGKVNSKRILIPQIDLLTLGGAATGSVAANWDAGVNWVSDMVFKGIDPGKKWEQMEGDLDGLVQVRGSADNGTWAMTIDNADVEGELRGYPLKLQTSAAKKRNDEWLIQQLRLENGPNFLTMNGSASDELQLDLDLDFPAIQTLIPTVAGNLKAMARVTGKADSPTVKLEASSSLIKLGDALFRELAVDANVVELARDESQLAFKVGILNAAAQEINDINGKLTGSIAKHKFDLALKGPSKTALSLSTTGSLPNAPGKETPSGDWSGVLQSVKVDVPEHSLSLAQPTALSWSQDSKSIEIDPHCWRDGSANLCLKDKISGHESGKAKVTLEGYNLSRLNSNLPANTRVEGSLGAESDLVWNIKDGEKFEVELNASVANGAIVVPAPEKEDQPANQTMRLGYDSLVVKARADPFTVVSDITLSSKQIGNAKVNLTLNPKNERKPILGKVSLQGLDVQLARPFLENFDEVDGTVGLEGDLSGTLTEPLFDGRLVVNNPILRSDDLPLSIDGGSLGANIIGNTAIIDGELKSGDDKLVLGGDAKWGKATSGDPWQANLTVDGEDLSIVQKPLIYSEVHPSLRISLRPGSVEVRGDIDIPAAEIDIKETTQGAATLSEDIVIIEDEEAKAEKAAEEEQVAASSTDILTDLRIQLGDDVNLSGYGLNARLTGEIDFKIENDDPPQLGGEIRVAEGFYKSYGQDLEIEDGQILFVGPVEQTTLNIKAVRNIDSEERVAGIHLEGAVAEPSVTLFTDPPDKTQENILSYIVLGRDLSSNQSSEESSLLARAALALTIQQGEGFATGFAESLGISDFQIDAAGSGDDTEVLVSGRLSRKLLLRYGRSVFAPQATLYLRYDINKRLYLEAAQGVQRAVDLFYSFSF